MAHGTMEETSNGVMQGSSIAWVYVNSLLEITYLKVYLKGSLPYKLIEYVVGI